MFAFNYARRADNSGWANHILKMVVGFGTGKVPLTSHNGLLMWIWFRSLVPQGGQGRYSADIYRNAPDQTPPPTPTGGTVDVDTGVVTPPANWSNVVITPGTGQRTFGSRAVINPIMDTGIITPTWGGVYTLGSEGLDGSDGTPGTEWSIGNAFPTAPNTGDIHLFSGNVAGGLSWLDTDGTTILLDAGQGDYARYDGSDWIKQGRLDGSGSLILPDEVIRYPWRTTLSAGYTAATELDVDGLPPFTGTFFLTGLVDDDGALRRYFEFGELSQDDDDLTLGLKPGATVTIQDTIYTVRSSQVVSGRNRIIFEEGTVLDFAQGESYTFIIYFLSDSHLNEFLADRVHASVITTAELRAGEDQRLEQALFGDTRVGQHFLAAPRGEGEAVLYRGHGRMSIGFQTSVPILTGEQSKNSGVYDAVRRFSSIGRIQIDQDGEYVTPPTFTVDPPDDAGGTTATLTAVIRSPQLKENETTPRGIESITIDDPGSMYDHQPNITINHGDGSGLMITPIMTGGRSRPQDIPREITERLPNGDLQPNAFYDFHQFSHTPSNGTDVPYFSLNLRQNLHNWRNVGTCITGLQVSDGSGVVIEGMLPLER